MLHLYALLHKIFGDAVDLFQCLTFSPVLKKLRPRVPERETAHLKVEQVARLLRWVDGKTYDVPIWLGVYVGMRVGEIMALRWYNVELDTGTIHIRASYSRKEKIIRDYPKGKKWHSHVLPEELLEKLRHAKKTATGEFVAPSPNLPMLSYDGYYSALKRYCREAEVPVIGTHGLRHSTSGLYMAHGASRDDLRKLFCHSSNAVTDLYVHDKGEKLDQVARVIRLFPKPEIKAQENLTELPCSTNVPYSGQNELEQKDGVC